MLKSNLKKRNSAKIYQYNLLKMLKYRQKTNNLPKINNKT